MAFLYSENFHGGEGQGRDMGLEIQTTMDKIDSNKNILYSTGNDSHYFIITFNEV